MVKLPKPFEAQPFKASDSVLRELVAERRREVEHLQRQQAEHLQDVEERGQTKLKALKGMLGKEQAGLLDKLESLHKDEVKKTEALVEKTKETLSKRAPAMTLAEASPLSYGRSLERAVGWVTPYYATLHGSDGSVYWQGYNPGTFDLSDWASGSGSGIFGTGAGSFTVYLDWWFTFRADASAYYNHTIYVPFNGFYIVRADDGFWDSKEAKVRIDLSARGYQYNWKAGSSTNVLDISSQNINVNDRFDGWRTAYYADLLGGGDSAYLLVSASFYVYARGGGSYAELNFSAGDANYIGVPWVYVS
jgi:hypothetical protein